MCNEGQTYSYYGKLCHLNRFIAQLCYESRYFRPLSEFENVKIGEVDFFQILRKCPNLSFVTRILQIEFSSLNRLLEYFKNWRKSDGNFPSEKVGLQISQMSTSLNSTCWIYLRDAHFPGKELWTVPKVRSTMLEFVEPARKYHFTLGNKQNISCWLLDSPSY